MLQKVIQFLSEKGVMETFGEWLRGQRTARKLTREEFAERVGCSVAMPLQIHYTEDVAVYVLEGALTFFWGSEKREAAVGSFFYQPRGTPHGFRVEGARPAQILYMTMPAGFDRFVLGVISTHLIKEMGGT